MGSQNRLAGFAPPQSWERVIWTLACGCYASFALKVEDAEGRVGGDSRDLRRKPTVFFLEASVGSWAAGTGPFQTGSERA